MKINTNQEQGKEAINNLIGITKDKPTIIRRMFKEGKIKKLNIKCYSVSSECFKLGITPKQIKEVLEGLKNEV